MMLVSFPKCHLVYKSIKASNLKCIISIGAMERILTIYPLYSKIRGLYSQLKNTIEKYTLPYFFGYYRGITYLLTMLGLNVHYPKVACSDFFCLIEVNL